MRKSRAHRRYVIGVCVNSEFRTTDAQTVLRNCWRNASSRNAPVLDFQCQVDAILVMAIVD